LLPVPGLFFGSTDDPAVIVGLIRSLTVNDNQVRWASVTPPQLTRDTPILRIGQPSSPLVGRALGKDLEFTCGRSSKRFGGSVLEVDPPLRLHDGLNDITRLAANGDLHRVVLGLDVKTLLLQGFQDRRSHMESLHALETLSGILVVGSVVVHQVDEFQVVPLSTFVVVVIVGRGDLDGTGTESHVDGDGVADDGDSSVDEWMDGKLAVEMLENNASAFK
jgi:hypothetical protein